LKLKTHNSFSIAILTICGVFFTTPLISLISAAIISIIGNQIIDTLGHTKNYRGIPVRTYKTHSLLRSILYGSIPAVLLFIVVKALHISYLPAIPYFILIQGIFLGPTHLAMDIITEGGIFVKKNGRFQRYAISHIRYNDMFWNLFYQVIGIALIILVFYQSGYFSHTGGFNGRIF
jgi:hypothetical protein